MSLENVDQFIQLCAILAQIGVVYIWRAFIDHAFIIRILVDLSYIVVRLSQLVDGDLRG